MIDLSQADLLGKGSSRACYVHPYDEHKCVKVTFSASRNITSEELKHYRRYMKRGISWDMISKAHGYVKTNFGEGAVFSLARDYTGEVSRPLEHYLRPDGLYLLSEEELLKAISAFRAYLFRERIVLRELKVDNLVYQRLNAHEGKIILIDGIGNNEFLPVANYSVRFAWRTLKRKWLKFEQRLLIFYPGNVALQRLFKDFHREL
ncbi:YrbL family protein [Chlorobium limicola]